MHIRSCFLIRLSFLVLVAWCMTLLPGQAVAEPYTGHGFAMHGQPKYGPDFQHFDYVNPDAPKGGTFRQPGLGTFDTLHPFTLKGVSASGLGLTYDSLMSQAMDEPFSVYGLIAKSITVPDDRAWVRFELRPEARWHDGTAITAEDVVFSFDILKSKGAPFYRSYFSAVQSAKVDGSHTVTFTFDKAGNRELPLIIANQLPILPKHYWQDKDFAATTLTPPLGSGPYRIAKFEPGRSITFARVKDYWGKDLPVNVGRYNPDTIRYDYYRDTTVALEAFKAGAFDLRSEYSAKNWATAYDFPAAKDGRVIMDAIPKHTPSGMQGYIYNLRRSLFQDDGVRQALAYAFDFEWTNATLFYDAYQRTNSYFENSELAANDVPDASELALLAPYREQLPPEVFTTVYQAPKVEGKYGLRQNLRTALKLLKDAGYSLQNGVMTKNGRPLKFEILTHSGQASAMERVTLPFIQNLKKIGVQARFRAVDVNQFLNRIQQFDFDMVIGSYPQSLSPGNEQISYFHSSTANTPGSRNYAGVQNPVVDDLIDKIIHAETRESLITATRALDRVLLWNHYVIPHWSTAADRVAYWSRLQHPKAVPMRGMDITTWWVKPSDPAPTTVSPDAKP